MSSHRWARRQGLGWLGVVALIVGLVHAPLPEPDFHNIRHHDGPGEVCEYHDHLLRWHPGARWAEDVAVLHWHWLVPGVADQDLGMPMRDAQPALHAHVPDWQAARWDDGPRLSPDSAPRPIVRPALSPVAQVAPPDLADALAARRATGSPRPFAFGATFAPRASLTSMLQRWIC